ncbi:site-specific integrase [Maribellus comscasis]|uniref:Site-specific integrase n=1 Tax=Maribellus comscasis TaxID=2681766 RepID=A0A6I6JXD6_9BACT|nr:site-specific integrase [Maribellus comscasis]QGY47755.1 site-specific integrase [Maribellus comscasis]
MKRKTLTATFGVHFVIRKEKAKNGNAPIFARISVNRQRCEVSVKKSITVRDWDSRKGRVKSWKDEYKNLNSFLEQVRTILVEHYQDLVVENEEITPTAVKNRFLGLDDSGYSLLELFDYHNDQMQKVLKWGTLKNYFTTKKYMVLYLEAHLKRKDIPLTLLNYKFISEFENFLRNYQPLDHHKPLGNNGVMKHLERLRKVITLAVKMEWINKNPFASYRLKFKKVNRECLTGEELHKLENKNIEIQRLRYVRDLFVFSCYTGLTYGDVMRLSPTNLQCGIDGELWIFTHREKTDNPVPVPLLPKAKATIKKYREHPKSFSRGTIFPLISNQNLNAYLKEIADICGIKKHLTFHLARHTFATTITF